jgi:hypothetical protein
MKLINEDVGRDNRCQCSKKIIDEALEEISLDKKV